MRESLFNSSVDSDWPSNTPKSMCVLGMKKGKNWQEANVWRSDPSDFSTKSSTKRVKCCVAFYVLSLFSCPTWICCQLTVLFSSLHYGCSILERRGTARLIPRYSLSSVKWCSVVSRDSFLHPKKKKDHFWYTLWYTNRGEKEHSQAAVTLESFQVAEKRGGWWRRERERRRMGWVSV